MTPLGLYIHVPFCRQKCHWCAFSSEEGTLGLESWLERLLVQLDSPPVPEARWTTVYLGGGTPSLLNPQQLDRLLAAVEYRLEPGAEMTFEANPESLLAEHLDVLARRGGTRLSLGIQTFDESILIRHGRPTRSRHLTNAKSLVQKWRGDLSLDLICGLEGQTESGQGRDLDQALEWNPDHLSYYCLTLEPGTPLGRRVAAGASTIPNDDSTAAWWLEGRERLEAAGLSQYEVSNFAKPGAGSLHNDRYWSLLPWWGVGPSATSFLPRKDQGFEYRTEPSALRDWLAGQAAEIDPLTPLDLAKDRLLAGLRRTMGVSAKPWVDLLPRTLQAWQGRCLVQDGHLFLSREAFPFLDAFLREAFAELDGRPEFR